MDRNARRDSLSHRSVTLPFEAIFYGNEKPEISPSNSTERRGDHRQTDFQRIQPTGGDGREVEALTDLVTCNNDIFDFEHEHSNLCENPKRTIGVRHASSLHQGHIKQSSLPLQT